MRLLLGIWALVVALSGCQYFLATEEPLATWVPLPTVGPTPTDTAPPTTAIPTSTMTPVPTETFPPTAEPTKTPSPDDAVVRAAWARDKAWMHLVNTSSDDRLPAESIWVESGSEPLIGATTYRYQAEDWTLIVSVPVVAPEATVYNVEVKGPDGFEWVARVEPDGTVKAELPATTATPTPETTPEVVEGWRGTLHSLPQGAQFDDFFRVLGGEGGQFGIGSLDASIEERLAALRDSGRIVRLWGTLARQAPDYGETQIVVERLEEEPPPATPVPESELVEGWIGIVRALPPGSAYDDYFDAHYPGGQYGIGSLVPKLEEELAAYGNSGTIIRIWGVLDYGIPDYSGRRILVTRIEEG